MKNLSWIEKYNLTNDGEYKNYVKTGKYLAIYFPEHHLARKDGYVYIHQLQAEKKLNRPLTKTEVVHHIDEDKYNNNIDNLIIFKTNADHTSYHHGGTLIYNDDGTCSSTRVEKKCKCCGSPISVGAVLCLDCYKLNQAKNIPTKETLLQYLKQYNISNIGRIFNVDGNSVRKWCKKYNIPYKKKELIIFLNSY